MAPAWRIRGSHLPGSASASSRCSGATRLPARGERGLDDLAARQSWRFAPQGEAHAFQERCIRGEQDRLGELVVLGLREEVHRDPVGVGARVGDHQDLRGPSHHVDAHAPENTPLRGRHVRIPWAHYLVDRRYRGGAECEGADGLRAADPEDPVHARERGGGEHRGVDHAARRGRHHHELGNARDLRRDRAHDDRGRIRRLAARHVHAHAVEGGDLLPELGAVVLAHAPGLDPLALVVGPDALHGELERFALDHGQGLEGRAGLACRDLELGGRARRPAVEARGEFQQRRVAPGPHCFQDLLGRALDGGILRRLEREQARELGLEGGQPAVQAPRLSHGRPRGSLRSPARPRRALP
jgi:hypothetical protein